MRAMTYLAAAILLLAARPARAAGSLEAAMQPILTEYLTIQKALAADKDAGVTAAAARLEKLAAALKAKKSALPRDLKTAAGKLRQTRGLEKLREVFKELSKPMVSWALSSRPRGVHVATCSMAKASWLQRETEIANPYYGSKMLRCGELTTK
jgi:hypothetical protein